MNGTTLCAKRDMKSCSNREAKNLPNGTDTRCQSETWQLQNNPLRTEYEVEGESEAHKNKLG